MASEQDSTRTLHRSPFWFYVAVAFFAISLAILVAPIPDGYSAWTVVVAFISIFAYAGTPVEIKVKANE